jgi:hypothetical protein
MCAGPGRISYECVYKYVFILFFPFSLYYFLRLSVLYIPAYHVY